MVRVFGLVGVFCLFFLLVCSSSVCAGLVVSPSSIVLSQDWYVEKSYSLTLTNNGSVDLFNVVFSGLDYFSFPSGLNLSANSSKVVNYKVFTNEVFSSRKLVSSVSGFYKVPFVPNSSVVQVNITSSGLVPSVVVLKRDDVVQWNNRLGEGVVLKGLGSGFGQVAVPALGVASSTFGSLGNFSFYVDVNGFSGVVNVAEKENWTFEHDSGLDGVAVFRLSSSLPAGTMQVSVLNNNSIRVFSNETFVEALVEIRNLDDNLVLQDVTLSADNWTSFFVPNDFDVEAGGVRRVLFNVTPVVRHTNDTNRTHIVRLTVSSSNAGSVSQNVYVFVKYQDLDNLLLNGSTYNLLVLGVNQTIEACLAHMGDVGYESCEDLRDFFTVNRTIYSEVPADYVFSEAEVKEIKLQAMRYGNVSVRLENLMNRYVAHQDNVTVRVEGLSVRLDDLSNYTLRSEAERNEKVRKQNVRFWVVFGLCVFFVLCYWVLWLVEYLSYYRYLIQAGQL